MFELNKITKLLFFIFFIKFSFAQKYGDYKNTNDVKIFKSATIGNQVWMISNLNVKKFRNGDSIPEAKSNEEWLKAGENKTPAWCYYKNNPSNATKYGILYNWYAVIDHRGLAPEGWHIPSDHEWSKLVESLGGSRLAGKKIKSKDGWKGSLGIGNGSNESNLSFYPGGDREWNGIFTNLGSNGNWWSVTEKDFEYAWYRTLDYYIDNIERYNAGKEVGMSIRCIKD
jgi:uncharacterized protein (TIGR02145 family)